jgi:putative effector of murein hydrolase
MWLYIATIIVYIPFLIWGSNDDMLKGFGVIIALTLSLFLNDKMIERTFHKTTEQSFVLAVTTLIVMIVLLFVFDILFTVLSSEGTWFRDVLDFIRYFGVVLFALHQYPKYFFMLLHRSG